MHEILLIVWVSLKVALCSTALVMLVAIPLAEVFSSTRSKIIKAGEVLIYLPMAMPPVAVGYGLLAMFGNNSLIGCLLNDLGLMLPFTFSGAVVAAFSVSLGLGVRTLKIAVQEINRDQINIARLLGGKKHTIFYRIILPQCGRAILGAAILVFIRALSEFGATMVFAGNSLGQTRTLALGIWVLIETPGRESDCLVLVAITLVIAIFSIVSSEILLRKSRM